MSEKNLKAEVFAWLASIDIAGAQRSRVQDSWSCRFDYLLGLWVEREFNFNRRLGIDYRVLHTYAREFLATV